MTLRKIILFGIGISVAVGGYFYYELNKKDLSEMNYKKCRMKIVEMNDSLGGLEKNSFLNSEKILRLKKEIKNKEKGCPSIYLNSNW